MENIEHPFCKMVYYDPHLKILHGEDEIGIINTTGAEIFVSLKNAGSNITVDCVIKKTQEYVHLKLQEIDFITIQ